MICVNAFADAQARKVKIPISFLEKFTLILSPFAPHLAEELWQHTGKIDMLAFHRWPPYSPELLEEETYRIVIQVNGKVRDSVDVAKETPEAELKKIVLGKETIKKWTEGKTISKTILIPNRLINIVLS